VSTSLPDPPMSARFTDGYRLPSTGMAPKYDLRTLQNSYLRTGKR